MSEHNAPIPLPDKGLRAGSKENRWTCANCTPGSRSRRSGEHANAWPRPSSRWWAATSLIRGGRGFFDPWEVADEQGRTWKVVSDASLSHVPSHLRAEVVTPVLAYPDIPTLQEVIRAVRKCGAKVDRHCGIHVHVDASRFDGRTLGNLAKIVYKQEPLILAALGVTENRQRSYTRPVRDDLIRDIERHRPRTTDEINPIWYGYHNRHPQHFDGTRYHGVNLHNVWYRGTVEFRWFEATLHAGKVKAYIQLVLAVATKALNGRAASSCKRHLDPRSARYDFRVFLLHLDMIGDEFKTARKHLLAALPGDSAFRLGRPAHEAPPAIEAEPISTEAGPQIRPPDFGHEETGRTEGETTR